MKDNDAKFELIEKYFEGKLTSAEQVTFDHLMASSQEFVRDVSDYREITAFTDFLEEEILLKDIDITNRQIDQSKTASSYQLKANAPVNTKGQRAIVKPLFLSQGVSNRYAAAVILFLVSMVVVSLMFSDLNLGQKTATIKKQPRVLQVEHEVALNNKISNEPNKEEAVSTTKQSTTEMTSNLLAANFQVNETMEKYLLAYNRELRGLNQNQAKLFEVLKPQKTVTNELKIQWKAADASAKIIIVNIVDNKGKRALKDHNFPSNAGAGNGTTLDVSTLKSGLYYWRILDEDTEKVLFVGKFTKGNK